MLNLDVTTATARTLADEAARLGIATPEPVAQAIAMLDAVPGPRDELEPLNAWAPTTAEEVREMVQRRSLAHASLAGRPAAYGEVRTLLSRRLIGAVKGAAGHYLTGLAERFDAAGEDFARAVDNLPADASPANVLDAGKKVVDAWGKAKAAADVLSVVASTYAHGADFAGWESKLGRIETVLTFAELTSLEAEQTLAQQFRTPSDHPLEPWLGLIRHRHVARLRLSGPGTRRAEHERLTAALPPAPPIKVRRIA